MIDRGTYDDTVTALLAKDYGLMQAPTPEGSSWRHMMILGLRKQGLVAEDAALVIARMHKAGQSAIESLQPSTEATDRPKPYLVREVLVSEFGWGAEDLSPAWVDAAIAHGLAREWSVKVTADAVHRMSIAFDAT